MIKTLITSLLLLALIPSSSIAGEQVHTAQGTASIGPEDIDYIVSLGETSYLPSTLEVILPKHLENSKIRALVRIDSRLLALNLNQNQPSPNRSVKFPTPVDKLSLKFQLKTNSGRTFVSSAHEIRPRCEEAVSTSLAEQSIRFEEQESLSSEVLEFQNRILQLETTLAAVDRIKSEENTK